jgi:hypothetical protein
MLETLDQSPEHLASQGSKALTLGHAPVMESITPGHVQTVEELASREERRCFLKRLKTGAARASNQQIRNANCVHLCAARKELNTLPIGFEPCPRLVIHDRPQLGQAPP